MIKNFYIINKNGTCIYYINFDQYNKPKNDPNIVSGFFSSVIMFLSINDPKSYINDYKVCYLEWKKESIYFYEFQDYYFIFDSDKNSLNIHEWNHIFNHIEQIFIIDFIPLLHKNHCIVIESREFDQKIKNIVSKQQKINILRNIRKKDK